MTLEKISFDLLIIFKFDALNSDNFQILRLITHSIHSNLLIFDNCDIVAHRALLIAQFPQSGIRMTFKLKTKPFLEYKIKMDEQTQTTIVK